MAFCIGVRQAPARGSQTGLSTISGSSAEFAVFDAGEILDLPDYSVEFPRYRQATSVDCVSDAEP